VALGSSATRRPDRQLAHGPAVAGGEPVLVGYQTTTATALELSAAKLRRDALLAATRRAATAPVGGTSDEMRYAVSLC
jgi:hypothetical protein